MASEASVHESLDTAVANGYKEILTWDDQEIAEDLANYDSQFENTSIEELTPLVATWRAKQPRS